MTKPLDEWAKVFATEPDFFWAPINSIEDVIADEQFHAAGGVVYVPDEDVNSPMVATPADFHGTPWEPRSAAPDSANTPRRSSPNSERQPLQIKAILSRCRNDRGDGPVASTPRRRGWSRCAFGRRSVTLNL